MGDIHSRPRLRSIGPLLTWILSGPFILAGGLIFLLGGFLIFGVLYSLYEAHTTVSWPTVTGAVVSSEVMWQPHDPEFNPNWAKEPYQPFPEVRYTYKVNGREYSNDGVYLAISELCDLEHSEEVVAQYAPNQVVTVYYDRDDPYMAVLQPGISRTHFYLVFDIIYNLVLGFAVASVGLLIAVLGLIIHRSHRSRMVKAVA